MKMTPTGVDPMKMTPKGVDPMKMTPTGEFSQDDWNRQGRPALDAHLRSKQIGVSVLPGMIAWLDKQPGGRSAATRRAILAAMKAAGAPNPYNAKPMEFD
jgi:hypothetical protein